MTAPDNERRPRIGTEEEFRIEMGRYLAKRVDANNDSRLSQTEQVAMLGDALHSMRRLGISLTVDEANNSFSSPEAFQAKLQELVGPYVDVDRISQEQFDVLKPIIENFENDMTARRTR